MRSASIFTSRHKSGVLRSRSRAAMKRRSIIEPPVGRDGAVPLDLGEPRAQRDRQQLQIAAWRVAVGSVAQRFVVGSTDIGVAPDLPERRVPGEQVVAAGAKAERVRVVVAGRLATARDDVRPLQQPFGSAPLAEAAGATDGASEVVADLLALRVLAQRVIARERAARDRFAATLRGLAPLDRRLPPGCRGALHSRVCPPSFGARTDCSA